MIRTGRIQELSILRHTPAGLVLGDEDTAEVLLPESERPTNDTIGGTVRVFAYRDGEGKLKVTTQLPKAQVGEFAPMRVKAVTRDGALLEWGVPVDLIVPHSEQKKPLVEGRWVVVRVALHEATDHTYGSTRIEDHLDNSALTVKQGQEVSLVVYGRSDLGYSVVVNNLHHGLVHANEVFKHISVGDRIPGYVKTVRPDNKLDITLQPIGYRQYIDANTAMLAKRIQARGFIPLSDNSSAEEIYAEFGISKKAFKKALGALYKERLVRIGDDGVVWVG
jgi:predicted RNA-binding protein (virulence factor B family)